MHYMNDTYELALVLCGMDPENDEDFESGEDKIDEILYNKYGIEDIEGFERLVKKLAGMADVAKSPLTDKWYRGFGTGSLWIYKIEA